MKVASYILSFYFMILAGMSCADTVPPDNSNETLTVLSNADEHHNHDHTDGRDGCSPLCVCHCCHLHFLPASDLAFFQLVTFPAIHSTYILDFKSTEISGFLRPPISWYLCLAGQVCLVDNSVLLNRDYLFLPWLFAQKPSLIVGIFQFQPSSVVCWKSWIKQKRKARRRKKTDSIRF